MEANFRSERLVTYRTYKFNFTGTPSQPPDLRAFVYGTEPATSTTVFYVSWNCATEVEHWRFYSIVDGKEVVVGDKMKTGFETTFQVNGYKHAVFVEAVGADGLSILGRSEVQAPSIAAGWGRQAEDTEPLVDLTGESGTPTIHFRQQDVTRQHIRHQDADAASSIQHLEPSQTHEVAMESNAALQFAGKTEL